MKIHEVPEECKVYIVEMSNKNDFVINSQQKQAIMKAQSQFIELPDGDILNKSFIVSIVLDRDATKNRFQQLPAGKRKALAERMLNGK